MKKYIFYPVLFLSLVFISQVYALPRFALLRGMGNCLGCHVNPTGGQMRAAGGEAFAINNLAMWKRGDSTSFIGQIAQGLRLGGDFRSQALYFSQTTPLYGSPTGDTAHQPKFIKRGDTTVHITSFHSMSLALELDINATKTLHGFFRYDPINTITPSEGWAMLHFVHSSGEIFQSGDVVTNAYVKLGAFLPAFGIRFDDHTVYVKGGDGGLSGFSRAGFFWSPGYRDVGAEVGTLLFDHIGIVAGIFNGSESFPNGQPPNFATDPSNNKALCFRITSSGEIIEDMLAGEIGYSRYMHNHSNTDGTPANMALNAIHFSLRAGPVTILNEYDFGNNILPSGSDGATVPKAMALCSEAALRITKGFDAIVRYENFKDEYPAGVTNVEVKSRIMIGAQWFPLRFVEIRPEYRIAKGSIPNTNDPSIRDDFTENTLLVQTHFFF
jgi:hypothetical protein